jgi:hypothetical protein
MRKQTLALSLLAATLLGCTYEFVWKPIDAPGPIVGPNERARAYGRCKDSYFSPSPQCAWAYGTESGVRIDIYNALIPELDAYVQRSPQFQSWQPANMWAKERLPPYYFYLLTISPAIVVGVPAPLERTRECWQGAGAPHGKCLPSNIFLGGYEVATNVPIATGSVWFSPAASGGLVSIPEGVDDFGFPVPGAAARLTKRGGVWVFSRAK